MGRWAAALGEDCTAVEIRFEMLGQYGLRVRRKAEVGGLGEAGLGAAGGVSRLQPVRDGAGVRAGWQCALS